METVHWTDNDGNWADATGWDTGAVAVAGDDAVLAGSASGVQVDGNQAARSLTQSANANLSILRINALIAGLGEGVRPPA